MFPKEIQYNSDASLTKNFKSFLYPNNQLSNRTELRHFPFAGRAYLSRYKARAKISKSMHFLLGLGKRKEAGKSETGEK